MTNEEIAAKIRQGEPGLVPELWERVQKLINALAFRYFTTRGDRCAYCGVTPDDLKQEGFFAFLDALRAYKPDSDTRFASYLSFPLKNRFNTLTGGRKNNKQDAFNYSDSLNAPIPWAEDDDVEIQETVPSSNDDIGDYIERENNAVLRRTFDRLLDGFPSDERDVIQLRYWQGLTPEQTGAELGKTREQVRQIEAKAIRAFRRPVNRRELEGYIDLCTPWTLHIGANTFHSTGYSSVERIAEIRERMRPGTSSTYCANKKT